jgi:ketosteroid isomerase-like protein
MSRENVELVRSMYEAYLAGNFEAALSFFHPNAELDLSARGNTAVGRGPQGITKVVTSWTESWDDYSERIEEIRDLGDLVCVVSTQRGRGKGSGIEISHPWAFLVRVEDGLIARMTAYPDIDAALEAARG